MDKKIDIFAIGFVMVVGFTHIVLGIIYNNDMFYIGILFLMLAYCLYKISKLKKKIKNGVSKDTIREQIEKWDKNIAWANADDHYYAIKILQELLERSYIGMSNADKMFEELGARKTETASFISYTGKINKSARILFCKDSKDIILEGFNAIGMPELKAINEKVKELGWLE